MMFTTIAVALDLTADGDRALPVVHLLSELGDVDVELLTVDSPNVPPAIDDFELSRRATAQGWPAHSYTALRSNDVAAAIVDHLHGRDDVLLVMATTAKRPVIGHLLGSVTEQVLATTDRPVLLVGPEVPAELPWIAPTPVLCVDPSDLAEEAVPTIASWTHTFRSARPCVAEVITTCGQHARPLEATDSSHVRRYVDKLRAVGLDPRWTVTADENPEAGVLRIAGRIAEPLLVTTSNRWTDGHLHWHSVTRQLVRRWPAPILVVPARRDGVAVRSTDVSEPGPSPLARPDRQIDAPVMTTDRHGITVLDVHECWDLLRDTDVGRLAVCMHDEPEIFPINFVADRGTLVFRTAQGTKLVGAVEGRTVAFEADGYEPEAGEAWSVIVKGRAAEIERNDDLFDAMHLPLFPWHAGRKHHFVRIEPREVSGRRFRVTDESTWEVLPRTNA